MDKKQTAKLTEGDIGRSLIKMTIPMLMGSLVMILFYVVDTYFIGLLGVDELAAISFTFPVVMMIMSISMGLGVGLSSVLSREIGKENIDKVRRYTSYVLTLSTIILVVVTAIGIPTIDPLFRLLGAKKELIPLIREYLVIWYLGVPVISIAIVGNQAIRATGDTKSPSIIMITAVIVNLIFDVLLIFGIGPFPMLALKGAAIATFISSLWFMVFSFLILYKKGMLTLNMSNIEEMIIAWKGVLYIGIPTMFTNLIAPITAGIITMLISRYGNNAVAAFGICSRLEMFVTALMGALGGVITPFIGQNFGAGKHDRIKTAIKLSNWFSILYGIFIMLVYLLFSSGIASLFSDNEDVIKHTQMFLIILSISYGGVGVIKISTSVLNAINKPMNSTAIIVIQMIVLVVPFSLVGSKLYGLEGLFIGFTIANIISGVIAYLAIHQRFLKRTIRLETNLST